MMRKLISGGHPVDTPDTKSGSGFDAVPLFLAAQNKDQELFDLLYQINDKDK
jgi:hypothetical protein